MAYAKVIGLFADLRALQIRQKKDDDEPQVIRRPAGDDWF
jgi:hypothetical protein